MEPARYQLITIKILAWLITPPLFLVGWIGRLTTFHISQPTSKNQGTPDVDNGDYHYGT